jgi:hypothetical protein
LAEKVGMLQGYQANMIFVQSLSPSVVILGVSVMRGHIQVCLVYSCCRAVLSIASCEVVKFGLVALVEGIFRTLAATSSTLSLHALFRGLGYIACLDFCVK